MEDDVLDGIFHDESEQQALARAEQRVRALASPFAWIDPNDENLPCVAITEDEFQGLVADQVFVAFLNRSGTLPTMLDYSGIPDLTPGERHSMYGSEGRAPWQQEDREDREDRLLTDGAVPIAAHQVMHAGPIHRRQKWQRDGTRGDPMLGTTVEFEVEGFVTDAVLATKKLGVFAVLTFDKALPMKPGNRLKFSVRLRDLVPPDPRALPPAALPDR